MEILKQLLQQKEILASIGTAVLSVIWLVYKYYIKYIEASQLRSEKQEIESKREQLNKEKESYEKQIEQTKEVIQDLNQCVRNGHIDEHKLNEILDRLEEAILPENERVLSKLDRIKYEVIDGNTE